MGPVESAVKSGRAQYRGRLWLGQLPILSRLTFVVPLQEIRDALDQLIGRLHVRHSVFERLADVLQVIHVILPIPGVGGLHPEPIRKPLSTKGISIKFLLSLRECEGAFPAI